LINSNIDDTLESVFFFSIQITLHSFFCLSALSLSLSLLFTLESLCCPTSSGFHLDFITSIVEVSYFQEKMTRNSSQCDDVDVQVDIGVDVDVDVGVGVDGDGEIQSCYFNMVLMRST